MPLFVRVVFFLTFAVLTLTRIFFNFFFLISIPFSVHDLPLSSVSVSVSPLIVDINS